MATDLIPTITSNAGAPKQYTGDGQTAVQQSLADQIAADKYAKAAAITSGLPFRTVKLRPGGNHDLHVHGECL